MRMQFSRHFDGFFAVDSLTHDFNTGDLIENFFNPNTDKIVVVDEEDVDHSEPGGLVGVGVGV